MVAVHSAHSGDRSRMPVGRAARITRSMVPPSGAQPPERRSRRLRNVAGLAWRCFSPLNRAQRSPDRAVRAPYDGDGCALELGGDARSSALSGVGETSIEAPASSRRQLACAGRHAFVADDAGDPGEGVSFRVCSAQRSKTFRTRALRARSSASAVRGGDAVARLSKELGSESHASGIRPGRDALAWIAGIVSYECMTARRKQARSPRARRASIDVLRRRPRQRRRARHRAELEGAAVAVVGSSDRSIGRPFGTRSARESSAKQGRRTSASASRALGGCAPLEGHGIG